MHFKNAENKKMYTPQNSDFFNAFVKRLQSACSQILCASGSGYKCCYNWFFNTSPLVGEVCFPIETELKSRKQGEGATRRETTKFPPFIGGGLMRGLSCKGKAFTYNLGVANANLEGWCKKAFTYNLGVANANLEGWCKKAFIYNLGVANANLEGWCKK